MENYPPLTFIQKLEPEDVMLFFTLTFCFILIAMGFNSFLGSVITTIVGFIVGHKAGPKNEQRRKAQN